MYCYIFSNETYIGTSYGSLLFPTYKYMLGNSIGLDLPVDYYVFTEQEKEKMKKSIEGYVADLIENREPFTKEYPKSAFENRVFLGEAFQLTRNSHDMKILGLLDFLDIIHESKKDDKKLYIKCGDKAYMK